MLMILGNNLLSDYQTPLGLPDGSAAIKRPTVIASPFVSMAFAWASFGVSSGIRKASANLTKHGISFQHGPLSCSILWRSRYPMTSTASKASAG
jgi:hypothetical protein